MKYKVNSVKLESLLWFKWHACGVFSSAFFSITERAMSKNRMQVVATLRESDSRNIKVFWENRRSWWRPNFRFQFFCRNTGNFKSSTIPCCFSECVWVITLLSRHAIVYTDEKFLSRWFTWHVVSSELVRKVTEKPNIAERFDQGLDLLLCLSNVWFVFLIETIGILHMVDMNTLPASRLLLKSHLNRTIPQNRGLTCVSIDVHFCKYDGQGGSRGRSV